MRDSNARYQCNCGLRSHDYWLWKEHQCQFNQKPTNLIEWGHHGANNQMVEDARKVQEFLRSCDEQRVDRKRTQKHKRVNHSTPEQKIRKNDCPIFGYAPRKLSERKAVDEV